MFQYPKDITSQKPARLVWETPREVGAAIEGQHLEKKKDVVDSAATKAKLEAAHAAEQQAHAAGDREAALASQQADALLQRNLPNEHLKGLLEKNLTRGELRIAERDEAKRDELFLAAFHKVTPPKDGVPEQVSAQEKPIRVNFGDVLRFNVPDADGSGREVEEGVGMRVIPRRTEDGKDIRVVSINGQKLYRVGDTFVDPNTHAYRAVHTADAENIKIEPSTPEDEAILKNLETAVGEQEKSAEQAARVMGEMMQNFSGSQAEKNAIFNGTMLLESSGDPGALNPDDNGAGPSFGLFQFNAYKGEMGPFAKYALKRDPSLQGQFPDDFLAKIQKPQGQPFSKEDLNNLRTFGRATYKLQIEYKTNHVRSLMSEYAPKHLNAANYQALMQDQRGAAVVLDAVNQFGEGGAVKVLNMAEATGKPENIVENILSASLARLEELYGPSSAHPNAGIISHRRDHRNPLLRSLPS